MMTFETFFQESFRFAGIRTRISDEKIHISPDANTMKNARKILIRAEANHWRCAKLEHDVERSKTTTLAVPVSVVFQFTPLA